MPLICLRLVVGHGEIDGPIPLVLHDPINVLNATGVPHFVAIDEHGVVRGTRARLDAFQTEFLEKVFPANGPTETAEPLTPPRQRALGKTGDTAADWRTLGVENLVIGKVEPAGAGQYRVQFRLFDVFRGRQITGYSLPASADKLRYVAHRISDIIYEALTGEPGAFATKIAYVISEKRSGKTVYKLELADSDGYNPKTLLSSAQPHRNSFPAASVVPLPINAPG